MTRAKEVPGSAIQQIDRLTDFEKHQLLEFLLYHLDSDVRRELMFALPIQYNKVVGRTVMRVHQIIDND